MTAKTANSMVAPLRRVMVCSPSSAGWGRSDSLWQELGFFHPPGFSAASEQHGHLCRILEEAGAEVVRLPPSEELTLDAVYAHDASFATAAGVVILNPGKPNRVVESRVHKESYASLEVPVLGSMKPPGIAEAGDMVWLDEQTLLVGRGYRTNQAGIEQLRNLLEPQKVNIVSAPLPHGAGPASCLHLMSLISLLDEQTALVDLSLLAVETVELLCARGYRLIEIDTAERDTLACNVLSLGKRRLVALEENIRTNQCLVNAGFEVHSFPGSELCINGSGGPTCLTRPLVRGK